MKINIIILVLACIPLSIHSMEEESSSLSKIERFNQSMSKLPKAKLPSNNNNNEDVRLDVEGLEELPSDPSNNLLNFLNIQSKKMQQDFEPLIGEEAYKKIEGQSQWRESSSNFNIKRSKTDEPFYIIAQQQEVANQLMKLKMEQDNENREEDLARLRRQDRINVIFGICGGFAAVTAGAVSIAALVEALNDPTTATARVLSMATSFLF